MKKTSKPVAATTPQGILAEPPAPQKPFHIVGIGSSAGGLEALELLFGSVSVDCGVAFVVVQHLDPHHKDLMVELLQRITALPILQITDQMTVQPNHVYIIPPNRDLSILHGVLHLLDPAEPPGLRLPIDSFLNALAIDQKEFSIAVILSGMGSDGTQGIKAIKQNAGLVFAQEPSSASFDNMPLSAINTGLVDATADAGALIELILSYIYNTPQDSKSNRQTLNNKQNSLKKILVLLRANTGQDFSSYKQSTIFRRIERRMALHQLTSIEDYLTYIRSNAQEIDLLFKELLIGVTHFFRDVSVWEQLKTEIIPALLANYPTGGTLRAWIPACSTGEEAYTLAIIFREVVEQHYNTASSAHYALQIFATDLDRHAIDQARTGLYPAGISVNVSEARLRRFFLHENGHYRAGKEIREMIIFAPQNLLTNPPFTKLDIVSCRNLLIYLETDLQKKLFPLFHYALNARGILVLGSAETLGAATKFFSQAPGKNRIYIRKEATLSANGVDFPSVFTRQQLNQSSVKHLRANPSAAIPDVQELTDALLLHRYSPVAVLTMENGEILYINGKAGAYLEPASGKANLSIFAMAREELVGALNEAFGRAIRKKITVEIKQLRIGEKQVDVIVQPLKEPIGLNGMVLIVFTNVTTPIATIAIRKKSLKTDDSNQITVLNQQNMRMHEELRTTREEMQASQEELKSANEELQSANEELQSTNEELTTSKEEMQSINEELQTVNHELNAKLTELARTSDDMKNLLNSTNIATLFLDNELRVRRFTQKTTHIINLIPSDIGRPITDLVVPLHYPSLAADIREVLHTLAFSEVQVAAHDDRWFNVRIMPYRTQDNRIDGVVITFIDINITKTLEAIFREAQAILQNRFSEQTSQQDITDALEAALSKAQKVLEDCSISEIRESVKNPN